MKKLSKILCACLLSLSLAACSSNDKPSDQTEGNNPTDERITVKLGVVGTTNEWWDPAIAALKEEGIDLQLVVFSEYVQPNRALSEGEIDLNAFQHYAYLNKEIEEVGYDITAISDSIIAPFGIYSKKIASLDELKDGDQIAIPQDPTNGGRALKVLEQAGLIKVDPAAGYTPEVKDVTENKLNLQFVQVEASQTAALLDDVAAGFINGAHAVDNGYTPNQDAIYIEQVVEGGDNPYINVIVARTADKDNETYKKVIEAFKTAETAKVIEDVYKGAYKPAFTLE